MPPLRTVWFLSWWIACGGASIPGSVIGAEQPNIIFVLFDDLGYGEPNIFRADSPFRMPSMERLAREGMKFTDAHSASGVCTPTRYGVLTGRYPSRIGQFGVLTTYSPPIIPTSRLTVARLLKEQGYRTACIGKWHLGLTWDGQPGNEKQIPVGTPFRDGPLALGFDQFWGFTHARNIGTILSQDRVALNITPVEVQPLLAEKAVDWLDDQVGANSPFFLYLPLCTPHTPVVPAEAFHGQGGVTGKPNEVAYADWIYQGDHVLGQVLAALDRHQLANNTLVIATSDNGAAGRNYPPLREFKASIYEGGHRVPFVARWPGQVAAGSVCDRTVCLNDLLATCAEITGATLPPDAGEDSVSLLPLLKGSSDGGRDTTIHQSHSGRLAIRSGEWKLIFQVGGEQPELYNLASDLSETMNLAAEQPEVVARLSARMQSLIDNGRTTAGPQQPNQTEFRLEGPPPKGKKAKRQAADAD